MNRRMVVRCAIVALAVGLAGVVLSADTLILRDGRRIEGQLVSVQRGIVQFREARGFLSSRTIEIPLAEVRRIEIDEAPAGGGGGRPDAGGTRGGRPGGLRERDVWVAANKPWTDTGFDVRPGQVLYFTTHGGDIQFRRGGKTRANGDSGQRRNPALPVPSRGVGALIAKVGAGSNDLFFIGEGEGPVRMRGGGRLFLGINDDYLADNSGAFRVTVFY